MHLARIHPYNNPVHYALLTLSHYCVMEPAGLYSYNTTVHHEPYHHHTMVWHSGQVRLCEISDWVARCLQCPHIQNWYSRIGRPVTMQVGYLVSQLGHTVALGEMGGKQIVLTLLLWSSTHQPILHPITQVHAINHRPNSWPQNVHHQRLFSSPMDFWV